MDYGSILAKYALDIDAIKINAKNPFTWVSGFKMPIYTDNRVFLSRPECRKLIARGFMNILKSKNIDCDIIAGVATSGIPFAATLADLMNKPLIYVRAKSKDHGTKKTIEGVGNISEIKGKSVVLIEDLISFGTNSIPCVQEIRNAGGICNYCLVIFDYEFEVGVSAYNEIECKKISLLNYETLLDVFKNEKKSGTEEEEILREWRKDPLRWGEKHGFKKVE